jgi:hypothetical protein
LFSANIAAFPCGSLFLDAKYFGDESDHRLVAYEVKLTR